MYSALNSIPLNGGNVNGRLIFARSRTKSTIDLESLTPTLFFDNKISIARAPWFLNVFPAVVTILDCFAPSNPAIPWNLILPSPSPLASIYAASENILGSVFDKSFS